MCVYDRLSILFYVFSFLCCEKKFEQDLFKSARSRLFAASQNPHLPAIPLGSSATWSTHSVVYTGVCISKLGKGGRTLLITQTWSQATGIQNRVPFYCMYDVGKVFSPINGGNKTYLQGCLGRSNEIIDVRSWAKDLETSKDSAILSCY